VELTWTPQVLPSATKYDSFITLETHLYLNFTNVLNLCELITNPTNCRIPKSEGTNECTDLALANTTIIHPRSKHKVCFAKCRYYYHFSASMEHVFMAWRKVNVDYEVPRITWTWVPSLPSLHCCTDNILNEKHNGKANMRNYKMLDMVLDRLDNVW
jgi:hypothetical protein